MAYTLVDFAAAGYFAFAARHGRYISAYTPTSHRWNSASTPGRRYRRPSRAFDGSSWISCRYRLLTCLPAMTPSLGLCRLAPRWNFGSSILYQSVHSNSGSVVIYRLRLHTCLVPPAYKPSLYNTHHRRILDWSTTPTRSCLHVRMRIYQSVMTPSLCVHAYSRRLEFKATQPLV